MDDKRVAYCVLRGPSLDAYRSTCALCRLPSIVHRSPSVILRQPLVAAMLR